MTKPKDVTYHRYRQLRAIVLARDPWCVYCGEPSTHADHIVPGKLGGKTTLGNLQGTCADCNLRKGAAAAPRRNKKVEKRVAAILRGKSRPRPPATDPSLSIPYEVSRQWDLSPKPKDTNGD